MKILFIKLTTGFYGGEKQTVDLIEGLAERGHQMGVITLPSSELGVRLKSFRKAEFSLLPYPTNRKTSLIFLLFLPWHWSRALVCLWRLRGSVDVIVLQEPHEKIVFTPIARMLGIKTIWLELLYWEPYLVNNFLLYYPLKVVSFWLDGLILTSRFLSNQLSRHIRVKHQALIRHALNPNEQKTFASLRRKSSYPIETLGFAGSVTVVKGALLLYEAFKRVSAKYPNLRLYYAGNGAAQNLLELKIESDKLGQRVKLLGKVPIEEFFARVDALIVPSLYENLPYIIQEGIHAGKPIIASSTGGIAELFPDNTLLFHPGSVDQLTSQIERIVKLRREDIEKIASQNLNHIKTNFLYSDMIDRTEKFCRKVFESK